MFYCEKAIVGRILLLVMVAYMGSVPCHALDAHLAASPPTIQFLPLTTTPALSAGTMLIPYLLIDQESHRAGLTVEYRWGDNFNSYTRPAHYQFPFGGSNGPIGRDGLPGSGAWKLMGNADMIWWIGSAYHSPSPEWPVAIMEHTMLGKPGQPFDLEINIISWHRTYTQWNYAADYEGIGIYIATDDFTQWFFTGGFDDYGGTQEGQSVSNYSVWKLDNHYPGHEIQGPYPPNWEPIMPHLPLPDGRTPTTASFRLVRKPDRLDAYARANENNYEHKGGLTTLGTSLDFNENLRVGVFVNSGYGLGGHLVEIIFDTIVSPWSPAMDGSGGDGTQHLTTSPEGVAHDYDWDIGTDLELFAGVGTSMNAQLRMQGNDVNGYGPVQESELFSVLTDVGTTNTPTPSPVVTPTNTAVVGTRSLPSLAVAGEPITVEITLEYTDELSSLGLIETLPENWGFVSTQGDHKPNLANQTGQQIQLLWTTPPSGPISFSYTVTSDASDWGVYGIAGALSFTIGLGEPQFNFIPTSEMGIIPPSQTPSPTPIPVNTAVIGTRVVSDPLETEETTIEITLEYDSALSALGVIETIPAGWTYLSRSGTNSPDMARQVGREIEFLWSMPPDNGPLLFNYTVNRDACNSGEHTINGTIVFTIGAGLPQTNLLPDSTFQVVDLCVTPTATPEPVDTPTPEPVETFTPEPIDTPTPEPTETPTIIPLLGDFNHDGVVDSKDLFIMTGAWHQILNATQ